MFHRYGASKPRWKCKRCVGEAVTRRHQTIKRILVEEAGGACCVCGYSLDAYRQEAKKCVLVCANCHGEIEAGLIPSPARGSRWRGQPPCAG